MSHFCRKAVTPALGLPPKPDCVSTAYGYTVHMVTSPPYMVPHPTLEPMSTPVQGPLLPVAALKAELIGDTLVCLSYTPQRQQH
jgi:hypothetical protein